MSTVTLSATITEWTGHITAAHHAQAQAPGRCSRCDGFACTVEVCLDSHVNQWNRPNECAEGGHVNDDNPGKPLCQTCQDWLVQP